MCIFSLTNTRRKFEVKLPTIWTDEKPSWAEAERRGEQKREDQRRERVRRKQMQMREKVGKSRNTVFFQWFEAPEGRKVGSLKQRVRSQLARREMKNCTPLWREAHFEVKMYKAHHIRTTFGSWDVEKVHAVVARSTFRSQNVQSTPRSDHFWKLRCRKSGREAHFEVKMLKTPGVRTPFGSWDVEKVHAVLGRSTFRSQNVQSTRGSDHFWKFRCRFAWQAQGIVHLVKSEQNVEFCSIFNYNHRYSTLHSSTLHYTTTTTTTTPSLHSTTQHSTTLHLITLNYTTLHYITLHYTPLHYTTLHYTTLPSTTLHYITLHYTPQHYNYNYTTTLHYTPLH